MVGFQTPAQKLPSAQVYVPPGAASSMAVPGEMDGATANCDPAALSGSTAIAPSGAGGAMKTSGSPCGCDAVGSAPPSSVPAVPSSPCAAHAARRPASAL